MRARDPLQQHRLEHFVFPCICIRMRSMSKRPNTRARASDDVDGVARMRCIGERIYAHGGCAHTEKGRKRAQRRRRRCVNITTAAYHHTLARIYVYMRRSDACADLKPSLVRLTRNTHSSSTVCIYYQMKSNIYARTLRRHTHTLTQTYALLHTCVCIFVRVCHLARLTMR